MYGLAHVVYSLVSRFGGLGLVGLYFLDSSFLFIPLGPDLLLIAMAAHHHKMAPYYAVMAAVGSIAGCAVLDVVSRKEGEKGLERLLSKNRFQSVTKKVKKGAAWALTVASLMPPPFPFTAVVAGASALQYPRKRLLTVVGAARLGRFMIEVILGIYFGRRLLTLAHSDALKIGVIVLIALSVIGSVVSVYEWTVKHKKSSK